jgi:hypothetical protein
MVRSRDARRRSATANGNVQLCGVGRSDSSQSSAAWGEAAGGRGVGRDVQRFRRTVLTGGAALDCARAVTAGAAAAGVLFVRSERLLMEQLNYNLLFRWSVGLEIDDAVCYWVLSRLGQLPQGEASCLAQACRPHPTALNRLLPCDFENCEGRY